MLVVSKYSISSLNILLSIFTLKNKAQKVRPPTKICKKILKKKKTMSDRHSEEEEEQRTPSEDSGRGEYDTRSEDQEERKRSDDENEINQNEEGKKEENGEVKEGQPDLRLFVAGFPASYTTTDVHDFLNRFGTTTDIYLIWKRGRFTGQVKAGFKADQTIDELISKMSQEEIEGQKLRVEPGHTQEQSKNIKMRHLEEKRARRMRYEDRRDDRYSRRYRYDDRDDYYRRRDDRYSRRRDSDSDDYYYSRHDRDRRDDYYRRRDDDDDYYYRRRDDDRYSRRRDSDSDDYRDSRRDDYSRRRDDDRDI